jgi:hypothetical protein
MIFVVPLSPPEKYRDGSLNLATTALFQIFTSHHVCFERCSIIVSTFEIRMGKDATELGEVRRIINEIEGGT